MSDKPPISISIQIRRVVIVTAAIAVLLTMLAMIAVAVFLARNAAHQRAKTIAELVAASADVPLVLKDAERGREALSALSRSEEVLSARLIDVSGNVLASHLHKRYAVELGRRKDSSLFERIGNAAEVTALSPVVNRGRARSC